MWTDAGRKCPSFCLGSKDPSYPAALHQIFDPPDRLWVRGRLDRLPEFLALPAIGVVGGRDCTTHGETVARRLAREIGLAGFVVVSGLARGIDAAAHRGALEVGGATVAVIGCGPDVVYPQANAGLRREILALGLLLGEQPPGAPPRKHHFPARNRILSGLTLGVVVVEARRRSGSLITARFALEQGREVFAVPGPALSPRAAGTNGLLKAGATPVENLDDILATLPWLAEVRAEPPPDERGGSATQCVAILSAIRDGAETVDELARYTGEGIEEIQKKLLDLELSGKIRRGSDDRCFPL